MQNVELRKRPVVLVIEDEPLLRLDALDIVTDAGFEGLEAASADEAISLLERREDVQVIFTDINLSGSIDGIALAHAIRRRWPPIRIVVTSGDMLAEESQLPAGVMPSLGW